MNRMTVVGLSLLLAVASGCRPREPVAPPPATTPLTASFDSPENGVRFSHPSDWSKVPSKDYVLQISPAGEPRTSVSLDVPRLPPHIPGLIPLGSVVNGYVDDLKKQDAGVKIDAPVATKVAGANARRVRSTRNARGETLVEIAVLTVHGDRVYIFRANSSPDREREAVEALDGVLGSVQWK